MNILDALKQLRDDIKIWVTNNLNALNAKIDSKTIPIDSKLSTTSTNPVQNKTITNAINNIPRFSGSYNDLTDAPNINEDDSGNMVIADESGNIIFKADADGIHTTAVSLNGEAAASQKYVDEAVANINIPETDLSDYYTKEQTDTAINTVKEELSESIVAESEEWKVVDEAGNIIFSVDASGAHTTALTLNGESVKDIVDERVATKIDKKVDKVDGKGLSTNDFTNEYKEKLDDLNLDNITFEETDPTVPAWAKAENKPTYTADEVGALSKNTPLFSGDYNDLENAPDISEDDSGDLVIADKNGNIIFRSNGDGFETVNLIVQNITINGKTIQEMIKAYVDEAILGGA